MKACKHGENCYRQNPDHIRDCHPPGHVPKTTGPANNNRTTCAQNDQPNSEGSSWACAECTLNNSALSGVCDACGASKPAIIGASIFGSAVQSSHQQSRETYENQRFMGVLRVGEWKPPFLRTDRKEWSSRDGKPLPREAVIPGHSWTWDGEWHVDEFGGLDEQGWEYAFDFPTFGACRKGKQSKTDWVRRRRWVRYVAGKCSVDNCSSVHKTETGSTFCSEHECSFKTCQSVRKRDAGSSFCSDHECSFANCSSIRKSDAGSSFCSEHECASINCKKLCQATEGGVFCPEHECTVSGCLLHNCTVHGKCSEHGRMASLSVRKDIGNSRYGTGDGANLRGDFSTINVTSMAWFEVPLSGTAAITKFGNKLLGWKHSILVLSCKWADTTFDLDLILEKCEVGDHHGFAEGCGTVGTNGCLLLSRGGTSLVESFGGQLRTHKDEEFLLHLTGGEQVTLRAVVGIADGSGPYTLERSNCHHMAMDVCNFIRLRKKKEKLKDKHIPNCNQLKAARSLGWLAQKMPGCKAQAGSGPSTVESDIQYGHSNCEGPGGINITREIKPQAVATVGASVFAGAVIGAVVCPAAAAGVAAAAKLAGDKIGFEFGFQGHAFEQADPCDVCGGDTATKYCDECRWRLCTGCAKKPKHRGHRVRGVHEAPATAPTATAMVSSWECPVCTFAENSPGSDTCAMCEANR
jgi:hypothetical protein